MSGDHAGRRSTTRAGRQVIALPDAFVHGTVEREGAAGRAWLATVPGIVDDLLRRWDCVPDGEVTHGGVGVIVPVRRAATGDAAVLKVSFPHPGNVHEPDAFTVWRGRGAVLLHERDDARFAMLLERAHTTTLAQTTDDDELLAVAGRISRRLAVPAPPGLPRLRDRAAAWEERLRTDAATLPHRLPRHVVDAAVATVRELGHGRADTLVHGDLHARNILRADREPWLAVDPKGYAGDPAYDGGTLLKTYAAQRATAGELPKAVRRALAVFSDAAGLDRERVRRWAQLHAVQAAFHGRRQGFRVARRGARLDGFIALVDQLAVLLTHAERR
ncbi:aminoglycoside phosphotransferase family protein [Streptomyces sp. NBC_00557]|uniref:aminoglycoside phosphotransferase family protein n=1 Tax=Streptomyces sp. NBC_00557 TaxID=2975776 RepID=UPI002E81BEA6|nr:aminoglycoside phosphotransferase family protein [Streptomyces sp. NBC_00557]WUC33522.1 aminoglycoside phosphotransferase family protein [Streptomyces sp. NBC_00557]